MLVRIKGIIEDILEAEGRSKENRPWKKKTYVIKDNTYQNDEYNRIVHVHDFGKLDPNSSEPVFLFKSNHLIGEEVDIACYLTTNSYGFTNVDYGKPYSEIDKPRESTSTGNVIKPEDKPAPVDEQPAEDNTLLPF